MTPAESIAGSVALLAQLSNWSRMGDRFSGSHLRLQTEDIVWAIVLVAFFAGLVGGLRWLGHWEKTRADRPRPKRLFRELCDAHALGGEDRRLLRALAETNRVAKAVDLFVRPELFAKAPAGLAADEVADLRKRLFGA